MRTHRMLGRTCRWLALGLSLLLAACSTATLPATMTPTSAGERPAMISAYHGHSSAIFAVAWSPDGSRIASGANDNTVQVWDAHTGRMLLRYTEHLGTVYSVAWSPDGTRIASSSDDATVQIWNATTGKLLADLFRPYIGCEAGGMVARRDTHRLRGQRQHHPGLERGDWQATCHLHPTSRLDLGDSLVARWSAHRIRRE